MSMDGHFCRRCGEFHCACENPRYAGDNVPPSSTSRMATILCVDDEQYWLNLVREWLGDHYEVIARDSASAALIRLEQEDVALVITDMEMRGMDGVRFAAEIKKRWPRLPVILWTSAPETPFCRADLTLDKAQESSAGPERFRRIVAQAIAK